LKNDVFNNKERKKIQRNYRNKTHRFFVLNGCISSLLAQYCPAENLDLPTIKENDDRQTSINGSELMYVVKNRQSTSYKK
jgi:hypothetical protein